MNIKKENFLFLVLVQKSIQSQFFLRFKAKFLDLTGKKNKYPFSWEATADPRLEQMRMIEELRKRIRFLEEEIVILKGKSLRS